MNMPEPFQRIPVYSADPQKSAGGSPEPTNSVSLKIALVCGEATGSVWGQSIADGLPELLKSAGVSIEQFSLRLAGREAGESFATLPRRFSKLYRLWRHVVVGVDTVVLVIDDRSRALLPSVVLAILTRFAGKQPVLVCDPASRLSAPRRRLVERFSRVLPVLFMVPHIPAGGARPTSVPVFAPRVSDRGHLRSSLQPHLWCPHVVDNLEGMVTLLRAVRLVSGKYPRTQCTVVFSQDLIRPAEELIRSERISGVVIRPQLEEQEVRRLAANADIVICTDSRFELAPATVLAGMSGQPAVVLTETSDAEEDPEATPRHSLLGDYVGLADWVCRLAGSSAEAEAASKRSSDWTGIFDHDQSARIWLAALDTHA